MSGFESGLFFGESLYDGQRPLERSEVEELADTVVWPAIDYLWKGDFRRNSKNLDAVNYSRTVTVDGQTTRLTISANCFVETEMEDPEDEVSLETAEENTFRQAVVCIERLVPELKEPLVSLAVSKQIEYMNDDDQDEITEQDIEERTEMVNHYYYPWDSKTIFFFDRPLEDNGAIIDVIAGLELQDDEGDTSWSEPELLGSPEEDVPSIDLSGNYDYSASKLLVASDNRILRQAIAEVGL